MSWFAGIHTGPSFAVPKVSSLEFRSEDQGTIGKILSPKNPIKIQVPLLLSLGFIGRKGDFSFLLGGHGGVYWPWNTSAFKQVFCIGGEITCAYHPQNLSLGFLELSSKDYIGVTFGIEGSSIQHHTMPVSLGKGFQCVKKRRSAFLAL